MKKTRHTPEQIVRMPRQAEAKLAAGSSVSETARELGISELTHLSFVHWVCPVSTDWLLLSHSASSHSSFLVL
jgi:hypothetical protein